MKVREAFFLFLLFTSLFVSIHNIFFNNAQNTTLLEATQEYGIRAYDKGYFEGSLNVLRKIENDTICFRDFETKHKLDSLNFVKKYSLTKQ